MNALTILRLGCAIVVCGFTLFGVVLFARACFVLVARMRLGAKAPQRLHPVWLRLGAMCKEVLGHRAFRGRPWIRIAHWLVMVSFPLLFLTLVTGYGQVLGGANFALPWLGKQLWWAWLVEVIAWLSLLGIVGLSWVRQRAHTKIVKASESTHPDANQNARTSRFFGSSTSQARFVEAVIVAVVVCVLLLRILDGALLQLTSPATDNWRYYPLTFWATPLFTSWGIEGLQAAISVVATLKIVISMSWMVVVGRQPAMGVAWHRFLAVLNVYARRDMRPSPAALDPAQTAPAATAQKLPEYLGAKALGPLEPVPFTRVDGTRAEVCAQTLDDLEAALDAGEENGTPVSLGVGRIQDFTWKGLLDFSSCTECGRCQELCPAWNTDKPLSPKLFTLALRDHHAAAAPYLRAATSLGLDPQEVTEAQAQSKGGILRGSKAGLAPGSAHTADVLGALLAAKAAPTAQGVATKPAPLVGAVISPDALWACTTCGACVDQCPVDIEHVDHLLDLRRQQVLIESAFPKDLGQMFRKLESKGNPWGLAPRKRMEWAKNLDFAVPIVGVDVEDAQAVDYLFWVGCAGAYEERAQKTTAAVAQLLHTAGVSFAVLADGESCSGDPARRAGNEILFQMLAAQNIDTLNEAHAQKIVVTCAHCFNTLAREYPQVGGHYEVIHHTQLLNRLVREGRLRLAPPHRTQPRPDATETADAPTVTYHDPCYLGRHNQLYAPPRELLQAAGITQLEMPRNRERALCCGGGGARAFMEESLGTRISTKRAQEAIATGAEVIATACPLCTMMLSNGVAGEKSPVQVMDVATLMLDAVQRAQNDASDNN